MVITEDGTSLVDQFLPEVVALQTAVMEGLSEAQRRQLLSLLAVLKTGLAAVDPDEVVRQAPRRGTPRHP